MSFAEDRQSITEHFASNWNDTSIAYDNADFRMPNDEAWVRITINPNTHFSPNDGYFAFSPTTIRMLGVVTIQVFCPLNVGDGLAYRLADEASDIFANKDLDNVQMRVPSIQRIGVREGWFQINVVIPYQRDSELI